MRKRSDANPGAIKGAGDYEKEPAVVKGATPVAPVELTPPPETKPEPATTGIPPIPRLPDNYQAIVTSTFSIPEPMELYRQIEQAIKAIKPSKLALAELLDALDMAQEYARLARQLYVNARATVESVEIDTQLVVSAMRDQALAVLEGEKAEGIRKKQITEADIVGLASRTFPDEWKASQEQLNRGKYTLSYLDSLCERTAERARDLRAIVTAARNV